MESFTTVPAMFEDMAIRRAEAPAVIDERHIVSYRELDALSLEVARSLLALGVESGDHVACLMRNRAEWIACFLASARIGAVFVPLNTWYKQAEIRWTLRHTGARVTISEPDFLGHDYAREFEEIEPALTHCAPGETQGDGVPEMRTLVYLGEPRRGAFGWNDFLELGRDTPHERVAQRTAAVSPSDRLLVLYTSGSTAEPKGVILPHGGVTGNGYGIGDRRGIVADDIIWLGSPLFYGLGATNALPVSLAHGSCLLVQDRFDAELAISRIETHQASVYYGMSNMTRQIYEAPGFSRDRVASLEKGTTGIERDERRIVLEELRVTGATCSYGATETCGNCLGGFPDDPSEIKLTTCGKLLPGFDAVVVDPATGEPLATGQPGLLKVRGNIALGYLNNPTETEAAFDGDGFYATGDLGAFDADGYFHYGGRLKEMIKTGGINVAPAEVESLITSHPAVSEAFVVGVPDSARGESIVAFVVAGRSLTESDVQGHVRGLAAAFKVPGRVVFIAADEVPRTASGKVPKQQFKSRALTEISVGS